MVDNIQSSDLLNSKALQQREILNLINSKKLQQSNPYDTSAFFDQTDISSEALSLFEKSSEIDKYKEIALSDDSDVESDKVAKFKALYETGNFQLPSDEDIAASMLGNDDFLNMLNI